MRVHQLIVEQCKTSTNMFINPPVGCYHLLPSLQCDCVVVLLRRYLQALQKMCKKQRDERDAALDAEHRALMRAAAIEADRDKIQRQFKVYTVLYICQIHMLELGTFWQTQNRGLSGP